MEPKTSGIKAVERGTVLPSFHDNFAWPVAILSFNRPNLLERVLRDLRGQTSGLKDKQVYLFQDSNIDPETGEVLIDEAVMQSCIALFKEIFPGGNLVRASVNLGIALNFDRAEHALLGPGGAEAAAFFEDDMALSKYYLEALSQLIDFALNEEKVGYVAAYGDHHASLEQQQQHRNKVVLMAHKWGFGLTRRQWLRQRPIIEPYLRLIEGKNYKLRDHKKIFAYFESLGCGSTASSQDAAKDVACSVLGTTKLMSYACYGKYLGESGVHYTPEFYRQAGFQDTVMFPGPVETFSFPTESQLDEMIARQRQAFRAQLDKQIAEAKAKDDKKPIGPPHLFEGELELLTSLMNAGHRRYLEFGMGGSTKLAMRSGFERIVSIDSDVKWIDLVRRDPDIAVAIETGRALIRHGDIGPVVEWGNPKNREQIQKWPNYIKAAWDAWNELGELPDLVFVDGRFRVACCLSVILAVGSNTDLRRTLRVAVHDVGPARPHYDEVLVFFDVAAQVNSLRIMKIKETVSPVPVLSAFLKYQFDQR